MNLTDEFTTLVKHLQDARLDFAICGGMALALHGRPRYTNDIDLLILPSDLAAVLTAVKACGYTDEPESIKLGQRKEKLVEIWRINKFQGEDFLTLDLVLASPFLEDVWQARERFQWQEQSFEVVSAAGLAKMKLLASRPQDLLDIQSLGFALDDPAIQP
jgi:hypothetical protein